MHQIQLLTLLSLALLVLAFCRASPVIGECVEETYCTATLEEYHAQLLNLPSRINERSVAAWTYIERVDIDRVPQIIHDANCLTSHSCKGMDNSFSLETVPITIKVPVLRKNPRCATYSLEFESINIACICVRSRQG